MVKRYFLIALVASLLAMSGLAFWQAAAAHASETCPVGSVGVQLTHTSLDKVAVDLPDGKAWVMKAVMKFIIGQCPPISGELDMRLQRHDRIRVGVFEWHTKPTPNSKATQNVGILPAGHRFTLRMQAACTGIANWRIRLHAAAGEAGDGTPVPPKTIFKFREGGTRFDCKRPPA